MQKSDPSARTLPGWLSAGILLVVLTAGRMSGQAPSTRVSIGTDKGAPGDRVFVSVTYLPTGNDEYRTVRAMIRFPHGLLRFEEATKGAALESGDLRAEELKSENPAVAVVSVSGTSDKPLPEGVLGYLTFRLLDAAKDKLGTKIELTGEAEASLKTDSEAAKPIEALGGFVDVTLQPAVFSCFFYMH